jgi:hypothetical protein
VSRFHKFGLIVVAALAIAGFAVQSGGATPGATIEVRKVLVPSNDPGLFNLLVRRTASTLITEVFDVSNGGHTARVAVPTGVNLTVEELAGTGTSLADYSPALDCFVQSGPDAGYHFPLVYWHGMVLVAKPGNNYTCIFTNTAVGGGGG